MTIRLLVLAAVLLTAVPVCAQDPAVPAPTGDGTTATQPPTNTGGGNTRQIVLDAIGAALNGPKWNAGIQIFGGYNQTNLGQAASSSTTLNSFIRSGVTAGVSSQLSTVFSGRKSTFGLTGGSSTNYFRSTDRFITSYHGQISQSFKLGSASSFNAGQSVNLAPYYALNQFQGLQTFAGTDLSAPIQGGVTSAVGDLRHLRYGVTADYSHPFTDRTSFTMNYSGDVSSLGGSTPNLIYQMAGAQLGRTFKKGLGVHAGYGYSQMSFRTTGQKQGFHHLDIGLNMNRGLSLTRRTKLTFGTGTVMNRSLNPGQLVTSTGTTPATGTSGTTTTGSTQGSHLLFNLTGNVSLAHDFGRSWVAQVNYGRSWQILDGTFVPFIGDTINGGLSGRIGSALTLGTNAAYMFLGQQSSQTTNQNLSSGNALAGNAFLNVHINNAINGFVQYGYYQQSLDLSQLGLNLPSRITRQTARGGLTIAFRGR